MVNEIKASDHSLKCRGTLCWRCARNTGRCSWSENFTPVVGWKAIKQRIKNASGDLMESYHVIYCPRFDMKAGQYVTIDCSEKLTVYVTHYVNSSPAVTTWQFTGSALYKNGVAVL